MKFGPSVMFKSNKPLPQKKTFFRSLNLINSFMTEAVIILKPVH